MGTAHRLVSEATPSLKGLHRIRFFSSSTSVPAHLRSLVRWSIRNPEASLGAKCRRTFGAWCVDQFATPRRASGLGAGAPSELSVSFRSGDVVEASRLCADERQAENSNLVLQMPSRCAARGINVRHLNRLHNPYEARMRRRPRSGGFQPPTVETISVETIYPDKSQASGINPVATNAD